MLTNGFQLLAFLAKLSNISFVKCTGSLGAALKPMSAPQVPKRAGPCMEGTNRTSMYDSEWEALLR